MTNIAEVETGPCRMVTQEEIDHYQEKGWVQLKRFIDPEFLSKMLAVAQGKMGEDGDSNTSMVPDGAEQDAQNGIAYFNVEYAGGLNHPVLRPLVLSAGKSAKALLNRKGDVGVRCYQDLFIPKLPSNKKTKHGGNGATSFHQDFITFSVDRSGGMTMWMPMEAYGPEFGTMSFVTGSHRLGVMGDYTTYVNGDVIDTFPELRDLPMTEQITYELGDITVHSHLMIHGAGANLTDRPRWAYLLNVQPEDICWNGSPCPNFDTSQMKPWQPLNDERFPLIG